MVHRPPVVLAIVIVAPYDHFESAVHLRAPSNKPVKWLLPFRMETSVAMSAHVVKDELTQLLTALVTRCMKRSKRSSVMCAVRLTRLPLRRRKLPVATWICPAGQKARYPACKKQASSMLFLTIKVVNTQIKS